MTTPNPVRDARHTLELSQAEFATRAGVSMATIQRCEREACLPTNWKTKRLVVTAMAPTPAADAAPPRRKTRAEEREEEEEAEAKERMEDEMARRKRIRLAREYQLAHNPPPMP